MTSVIQNTENLYPGLELRWEWRRSGNYFQEQIGDRYHLSPVGTAECVDEDWIVRLSDDLTVTLKVTELLDEGYLLYCSNPFFTSRLTTGLTHRLSGVYNIPVNDGAGSLNGSHTFTRTFDTPPIQHDAAQRIELLEAFLFEAADELKHRLLEQRGSLSDEEMEEKLEGLRAMFMALGCESLIPDVMRNFENTQPSWQ